MNKKKSKNNPILIYYIHSKYFTHYHTEHYNFNNLGPISTPDHRYQKNHFKSLLHLYEFFLIENLITIN